MKENIFNQREQVFHVDYVFLAVLKLISTVTSKKYHKVEKVKDKLQKQIDQRKNMLLDQ